LPVVGRSSGFGFQGYGARDRKGDTAMAEAKLAPKMQDWQIEHTNLYLSSGG
jgi:hypothetical protein